jgi:hypothetical protein
MLIDKNYVQSLIDNNIHMDEVEASEHELIVGNYMTAHEPVKILGLADNWNTSRWTLDFFKEQKGELSFPVKRKDAVTLKEDEKVMNLKEYIPYMYENERTPVENPFYLNTSFHPTDDLLPDYTVPDYFRCRFNNFRNDPDKTTLSWIYLAPTNSVTGLHIDTIASSAWNLVISGRKFWVFYPPEQNQWLYGGAVNPFAPDFSKHELYKNATPIICVQNPGEIIFTPSGWYHAVLNLKMGVSLTENFINQFNIEKVKAYCDSVGIPTAQLYEQFKNS